MNPFTRQQVVVVTGASAGVGRATVRKFARHKARIGLLARDEVALEATRREVEEAGGEALVLPTDVSDPNQVEAAAEAVEKEFGPIDIWINNAMVSVFSPVKQMTTEEYRRVTEVTYLGVVNGTLSALRRMFPRDHGTIVQVGSALAYRGIPLQSAYSACKHAVQGFTESLRTELIHDDSNVHVTIVHLPAVNTPQFGWVKTRMPRKPQPVPPVYEPEVAAQAIYWAAHHRRRELLVGWPTVRAVLGSIALPGFVARYLARTGYESQQYDGPPAPNREHNLWKPVPGDYGARGNFSERATDRSIQLRLNMHRDWILGGLAGFVTVLWALTRGRGRQSGCA